MSHAPIRTRIQASATPHELMWRHGADILQSPGMKLEKQFIQHGTTSVYAHSLSVTAQAIRIAQKLKLRVDERALVRGCLLHDYFLYDWHVKDPSHNLHGFRHPGFALANARRDFGVSAREKNMISRHMFPLTPLPPTCTEAVILCTADKLVATQETFRGFATAFLRRGERA